MFTSVHCFLNISRKEKNQMGFWLILKARRKGYKTRHFLIFSEVNFGKTTDLNSAETSFFCIFDRYLTDFIQFQSKYIWPESKPIIYLKSALKTESIHMCFKVFHRLCFSSKNSPGSPSGPNEKVKSLKTLLLLFNHLFFFILLKFYKLRTCFPLFKWLSN